MTGQEFWMDLLKEGLQEDTWQWDWCSLGVASDPGLTCRARLVCRASGVWAASSLLNAVKVLSRELGAEIEVDSQLRDGEKIRNGDEIALWMGHPRMVLALERSFLNLASHACGIATQTCGIVERVAEVSREKGLGVSPRVTLTRKTLPHYRDLAVHSVRVGGGYPHRVSLAGGVLIKNNHIAFAGSLERAVERVRRVAPHGLRMEVEVRNSDELISAMEVEVDGVLLDNFSAAEVQAAIDRIRSGGKRVLVEVSGGIHAENVREYVMDGVDVISMGALTHTVRPVDLSLWVG